MVGLTSSEERVWYDQFTSTDWVHDSIADGVRALRIKRMSGWRGRCYRLFDAGQGWLLIFLISLLVAHVAYAIDKTEAAVFDVKRGYCSDKPWLSHRECCLGAVSCSRWKTWSEVARTTNVGMIPVDYLLFVLSSMGLAAAACGVTLLSKTVVPSSVATTFDENLGAANVTNKHDGEDSVRPTLPPSIYYSAAGSGVAEVKVILSGFVLHGYLGLRTLVLKIVALVFSVASGMSLGKEGPYVHIATCIGNILCRLFDKYNLNDGRRREALSAAAACGVAVAFGSPLGGVLFGLEEVSYYFPSKTLFRTFFCCVVAALGLKFLDPYGTGKIVLFEVTYQTTWKSFELVFFVILGIAGGVLGACFIKASKAWATTFRRIPAFKNHPMTEVLLVAFITGVASFWNRYTRLPVAELLAELASPCTPGSTTGLCPAVEDIPGVVGYLLVAFLIKAFLTVVTFGIKVPAGIYVPSMVVGGLLGRIVGHGVQLLVHKYPHLPIFRQCSSVNAGTVAECITPGAYALAAAAATMCGVTRLTITLAVILFELSGSLDHVLPFALAILVAKWTADAIEPASIYDLLTDMNAYPFLDNKIHPIFDTELGDIVPRLRADRTVDITISPVVLASQLRAKVSRLQAIGELDGGIPIVYNKTLVGLIPVPDLEYALDNLKPLDHDSLCLMAPLHTHSDRTAYTWPVSTNYHDLESTTSGSSGSLDGDVTPTSEPTDLTDFIDPAPVALDVHSPMDLVYQCFTKLGLRYICATSDGKYAGIVHKKVFVRYVKGLERTR